MASKRYLGGENHPGEFRKLTRDEQRAVLDWIGRAVTRAHRVGASNSYGLKHHFEKSAHGFYLTNGAFKGAMREAGWKGHPAGVNDLYAARLTPEVRP